MALFSANKIPVRHGSQQDGIRRACALARDVLLLTAEQVKQGATTKEVDLFAASAIKARKVQKAVTR